MKRFSYRSMLKLDSCPPEHQFDFAVNQKDIWMIRYLILSDKVNLNIADVGGAPYWFALVRWVPCPAPQLIGLIRLAVHTEQTFTQEISYTEIFLKLLPVICMRAT